MYEDVVKGECFFKATQKNNMKENLSIAARLILAGLSKGTLYMSACDLIPKLCTVTLG
jgi:hypothetical protein